MAYFELEEGIETGTAHFVMTVLMSGIVAMATWELWGRHMAPYFYGHELSAASFIQALLGVQNKLTAEGVYFITAIPFTSLMYLFVWRPLLSTTMIANYWFVSGALYGLGLFVLSQALISFITTIPSYETLFAPAVSGWLIGALATGIATAGFIRLREMGRQII